MKPRVRSRRWRTLAPFIGAATLLVGCATSTAPTAQTAALPTAPAFQVRDVQGQTVTVPDSKPMVLLFGAASGCASCAASEQHMSQVYPEFRHQVEFVTVDVTPGDTKAAVLRFAQQLGASWPAVLTQGTNLLTLYHIEALNTMYVLNARGQIVLHSSTGLSASQLRTALKRALQPAGRPSAVSA